MITGWFISLRKLIFVSLLSLIFISLIIFYVPATRSNVYQARLALLAGNKSLEQIIYPGTEKQLPQAIIFGVRKCGTRALIEMLGLHANVVKSNSELHFFDDDSVYSNGLDWYKKNMPYSFHNQITIEKTPSYFISKDAPTRISLMNESTKLILIVRDPATRVLSDFTQISEVRKSKGKSVIPFEQKVINKDGEINENFIAIQISQYFVHMVRWLRIFSRDQIHIVDGDTLIENPYSEIKKVEKFLNLPSFFAPNNFYFNSTKGFYCLQNEFRRKCLSPSKGRQHPRVNEKVMSKLRSYFVPFNDHFYELVGQNFSWPSL